MIEVEMDVFSGVPNPRWFLTEDEEQQLLELLRTEPRQISPVTSETEKFGLGYRGFIIRIVKEGEAVRRTGESLGQPLPFEFRVGGKATRDEVSVAGWLLQTSARRYGLDDELLHIASQGVRTVSPPTFGRGETSQGGGSAERAGPADTAEPAEEERTGPERKAEEGPGGSVRGYVWHQPCPDPYYNGNEAYFNRPQWVTATNCYGFACNWLLGGRWARPGAYGGQPTPSPITVDGVRGGLYTDGWVDNCQPRSLTIAAVVWPGRDFHFYRLVTGGPYWEWGHKRGGTPAERRDDCGKSISYWEECRTPENCCRGDYTAWVGWFYNDNQRAFCKE